MRLWYDTRFWLLCTTTILAVSGAACQDPEELPETLPNWDVVVTDTEQLLAAHRAGLDAFVWPVSIDRTEQPSIYVRSEAPFALRVFRLGWYGGAGAQLEYHSGDELPASNADIKCGAGSNDVVVATGEEDFGLVECAWTNPVRPPIPNLVSGLYLAVVTATIQGTQHSNVAVFAVRDDASSSRLVIINPTDEQAYTDWSDTPDGDSPSGYKPSSLYQLHGKPRAAKVSFNRPMNTFGFFKTDYPLIRFLERENIPYTVATDYDIHINGNILVNRRSAIISGHGEYWSHETRSRLDEFVEQGGNLVAMASNTGYWQIRYEDSPAGLPGPVIVGYKETAKADAATTCPEVVIPNGELCADPFYRDGDETNDHLVTTYFRDSPVNKPEQLLFGVQYQTTPGALLFELPVTLFTNEIASMQSLGQGFTALGNQDIGVSDQSSSGWVGNIGWEADVIHPHVLLQMQPTACLREIGMSRWPWDAAISAENQIHLVLYRPNASSGYVFRASPCCGAGGWTTGRPLTALVDHDYRGSTRVSRH